LGVCGSGSGQEVPLFFFAGAGAPGGWYDDQVGSGSAQCGELVGEAEVVAGRQAYSDALDLDGDQRGAGGDEVGFAGAEGVVEVDLAVGGLYRRACREQGVVDAAVGGGFEETRDDDHSQLGSDLAKAGGERAVQGFRDRAEIGAESGQRRLGESNQ
jgi:hypothetical protein